jgi:PAS domain S-box-containing protein
MAVRLTKGQKELLEQLSSGVTEREAALRMKLSETELSALWQQIILKFQSSTPETVQDYALLSLYERVERRRLESELWASEARLTALMDTAPEAVLLINGRSGRILKANNQAMMLLGYSPRELLNQTMEMLVPPEIRTKHVGLRNGFLNSIRKREMGYHPPIFALTKDGRELELEIALTATAATDDVMVVCKLPDDVAAALAEDQTTAER